MGQRTTIELNGKKYDAVTGELLGQSLIKAAPGSRSELQRHGRNIDGFVRQQKAHQQPGKAHKQSALPISKPVGHKHFDIQRQTTKNMVKPHQPERPKTLMRHVVKKPEYSMKPAIKTTPQTGMTARPASEIAKPLEKKLSVSQVNPVRLARARHIAKSHHIRRFHAGHRRGEDRGSALPAGQIASVRPANYAARSMRPDFQSPKPAIIKTAASMTGPQSSKPQTTNDIFEAALAHANSHEQQTPLHAKRFTARRKRFVNIMAGIGAFLLIGGFATYMNMTNIEMRVASMQAGFHVQMPGYKPAGYVIDGKVERDAGKVAIHFRSGDSFFTITQEASEWNSTTLLDQAAIEHGQPKQTVQAKGRTIYIYNDSNATWVNGGVRYEVTGNASLDADELVALATSM